MNEVRDFLGNIGIETEHAGRLVSPGRAITACVECGMGERWKTVGTIEFDPAGCKRSFAMDAELADAARQALSPGSWFGREVAPENQTARRPNRDYLLARYVSRLADQVRDIRDVGHYAENPVHLPYTGEAVLRTVFDT